jgi:hypothetical protein
LTPTPARGTLSAMAVTCPQGMTIPFIPVSKRNPILSAKWLKYLYLRPHAAISALSVQLTEQRD